MKQLLDPSAARQAIPAIIGILAITLAFFGCSNPASEETGTITLNLGSGALMSRATSGYPPSDNPVTPGPASGPVLADLSYKVFFNGREIQPKEAGSSVIKFALAAGTYEIRVESYEPIGGSPLLYAVGKASNVQVVSGQNTTVPITMSEALTVTFNFNDGVTPPLAVQAGQGDLIPKPTDPAKALTAGLYLGAPPENISFNGWDDSGTLWNFAADVVNADMTLTAQWTPALIGGVPLNDVDAALAYVNGTPAEYTLILDTNISLGGSLTRGLNTANAKLTIIGLSAMRQITLTSTGRLFTIGGTSPVPGIELTLGNDITLAGFGGNDTSLVRVQNGASFTMLTGSKINGNTSNAVTTAEGWSGVYVTGSGSTFTMNGGEISNCTNTGPYTSPQGGGVYIQTNAGFVMNGGEINNCTLTGYDANGGGVYVSSGCTFTMNDGAISNCTVTGANSRGGGVFTVSNFTMTGGEISDCAAYNGGGVHLGIQSGGTATSYTIGGNAIIKDNQADLNGAGIYLGSNAALTLQGSAQIIGNTANAVGGGIRVGTETLMMTGGTISGNQATQGGGVYLGWGTGTGGAFTINSGFITGNTATDPFPAGGGLYINSSSSPTFSGSVYPGNITGNTGGDDIGP